MITDLTEYIIDHIIAWTESEGECPGPINPGIKYKNGYSLAYKDPEKGVIRKTSTDYVQCFDDRNANFLYIRFVDDEILTHNPTDQRVTSCLKSVQTIAKLRLVSFINDIVITDGLEKFEVEEFLRNTLLNIDWLAYPEDENNIEIELIQSMINNPQILDEERSKKDKKDTSHSRGFPLNLIFTVIDFTLKYNYHAKSK